jgi:hypothetical protein
LVADIIGDGVLLRGEINTYKIECSGCEMALVPVTWWLAYGHGVPATAITMNQPRGHAICGQHNINRCAEVTSHPTVL